MLRLTLLLVICIIKSYFSTVNQARKLPFPPPMI